jgi:hypothetical protein
MVKIVNFSENSYIPTYAYLDSSQKMLSSTASGVAAALSIQTGQNKITSTVTITYAIR